MKWRIESEFDPLSPLHHLLTFTLTFCFVFIALNRCDRL